MVRHLSFGFALVFLVALFPPASFACVQGQHTTIESITPQVAIGGITRVYILGFCFGETQAGGSPTPPSGSGITIGGTSVATYLLWSDGEIMFIAPSTAASGETSGDLVVTGASGSDDSANESSCNNWGWCGNGAIDANFVVYNPANPSFLPSKVDPAGPRSPEYVEGSWTFDDGYGDTGTYTLSQGTGGSVSGTVHWSYYYGEDGTCDQSFTGALDGSGNLTLNVGPQGTACGSYSVEFAILGSGDVTSQDYFYTEPFQTAPPLPNFPAELGKEASDGEILFKTSYLPTSETPSFLGWVAVSPGPDPTAGAWERTLPLSSDGIVEFSGRFVFEQTGQTGDDACHDAAAAEYGQAGVPYPALTAMSGGGWYVNTSGIWASGQAPGGGTNLQYSDDIGMSSDRVQWYQNELPAGSCYITNYQTMEIDTSSGPATYDTDRYGTSNVLQIQISNSPFDQVCTGVTPTVGISPGSECKDYPQ